MPLSLARLLPGLMTVLLICLPASAADIDAAPTVAPSAYLQQGGPSTGTTPMRSPRPLRSPRSAHSPKPAHAPSTKPHSPHHGRPAKPLASTSEQDHLVSFNARGHKFHEVGCRYWSGRAATQMLMSEAIAKGGKPCHLCHPAF
jgi:hypothetical protein